MVPKAGFFVSRPNKTSPSGRRQEVIMLKGLAKLAGGIVAIGVSVFAAIAATGIAGDGMAEAFGGPNGGKGTEGTVSRKVS
jgi:hypothetical protein